MNKSVRCIPFPEIPNAYIVISGRKKEGPNGVESAMSFFYGNVNGNVGAEWEPNYGPITVIYRCEKGHEQAQEHWFFPFCTGYSDWSQLAVNDKRLGEKFYSGDYVGIFNVLKSWAESGADYE